MTDPFGGVPFPETPEFPFGTVPAPPPKGVAFTPPPPEFIGGVMAAVQRAVAELPPDKTGALVAVADLAGVNATLVARVGHGWEAQAFIGKTWKGPLEARATVMKAW